MIRNKYLSILFCLLLIGLLSWSPWLTDSFAEIRAVDSFNRAWQSVADGCGTNCNGCGAILTRRVPFGALVAIEYACGLIPEDSPQYHERAEIFISAFGSAHGFPRP